MPHAEEINGAGVRAKILHLKERVFSDERVVSPGRRAHIIIMKFCSLCDNMMYISLSGDRKMSYHCKNCKNVEECESEESVCVLDNNHIDNESNYKQYLNKYLRYDNTLPRVTNITCPNPACTRKDDQTNEVIIIKYDFVDMKYLYHCEHCLEFWRT